MACRKYILSNTGNTVVTFNYLKCSDSESENQVPLRAGQTKTIQAVDGTLKYSDFFISSLNVSAETITATFDVTIYQQGSNVVINGSGKFNLDAVSFLGTLNGVFDFGYISPSLQTGYLTGICTGAINVNGIYNLYGNLDHQPNNGGFGFGTFTTTTSGTGPNFEVFRTTPFSLNKWSFKISSSYVSMTNFSSQGLYSNSTINSLGLTPGTYTLVWGPTDNNTIINIIVLSPNTPTPTPTVTNTPTQTATPTNTSTPTPTSTPSSFPIELSDGYGPNPDNCGGVAGPFVNGAFVSTLDWSAITRFYSDSSLTTGYDGNNLWYGGNSSNPSFIYNSCTYQIDSDGYVIDTYCC